MHVDTQEKEKTVHFMASLAAAILKLAVEFAASGAAWEQIALRWIHIFAGIAWVGTIYFMAVVVMPAMMKFDPAMRGKVALGLMPRAAWVGRFGALVTWLAGFRYFMIYAQSDAANAGDPGLAWRWIEIWLATWLVASAGIMGVLQTASKGFFARGPGIGIYTALLIAAAAKINLAYVAGPTTSNQTLCISVGGGIGTVMFLAAWGIVWRCQKKLIRWTRAAVEQGTPMPPEAARVQQVLLKTVWVGCGLTIPMLFFMEASSHFPFLWGK